MSPGPDQLGRAGLALNAWYDGRARDLPWRRDITPYRVLVSEVMLQQTRAETVIPRFDQFVERYPDAAALAAAPEEEVLKVWEGLGYYSRARNLHRAARQIAAQPDGAVPETYDELMKLPGVGPYTAAAVLSIACRKPVVAVDANAVRIALRLLARRESAADACSREAARQCLQNMMPDEAPDTFTQAVMELGQTVCRPRQALCAACPLFVWCAGKEDPLSYPSRPKHRAKPEADLTVAAVVADGRVALRKRPDKGLLAGLWEPLNWTGRMPEEEIRHRLESMGLEIRATESLQPWRHEFTHRVWRLSGWRFTVAAEQPLKGVVWVDRQELSQNYAVPTAFRPAVSE